MSNALRVIHPSSGRQIDVSALMSNLDKFDAPSHVPNAPLTTGIRAVIHRTIRVLNETVHDPDVVKPVELTNLFVDLYRLDDIFKAMEDTNELAA